MPASLENGCTGGRIELSEIGRCVVVGVSPARELFPCGYSCRQWGTAIRYPHGQVTVVVTRWHSQLPKSSLSGRSRSDSRYLGVPVSHALRPGTQLDPWLLA